MVHLIVQASKYIMMLLFLFYTYSCFHVFAHAVNPEKQKKIYRRQRKMAFLIHLNGFFVLYITTNDYRILGFYLMQVVCFLGLELIYRLYYRMASEMVLNNMIMLLMIGMLMLTRLNYDRALRQFLFMVAGFAAAVLIPAVMRSVSVFRKLSVLYAVIGIGLLAAVFAAGAVSYGAKLSISIAGFSFQPSEFVKILFVLFIASMMHDCHDLKRFMQTSVISAVFVLILAASNDLGGALIYFFTYLVMVYVATGRFYIFASGIGFLGAAFTGGYFLISHVRTRIVAWLDPLAVYTTAGGQLCQALFGIGTGGWFGTGLNQGLPEKIPVVTSDFIFAAIAEEMGGWFAFCIILVCISMFLMIFNVSLQLNNRFYKLTALGLGTTYAIQVFLMIGGGIKFIPSTGVTLPLISYGGSSLLATMLMFGIIQGLYIRQGEMHAEGHNRKTIVENDTLNTGRYDSMETEELDPVHIR